MESFGVDQLPVGVLSFDADDRLVAANPAFGTWFGGPVPIGSRLSDLLVGVDDFLDDAGLLSRMMRHPFRMDRYALVVREEQPAGATVIVMDASDRWEAGVRLRDSHALADRTQTRLQLVIDASIAFAAATTESRLGEILAETTAQAYRAEESAVFLTSPADGGLHRIAGAHPLDGVDPTLFVAATPGRHDVLRVSGTVAASRIDVDLGTAMTAAGVHALIAAPLHHEDEVLGLFVCYFRHPRLFDDEAAPLADALAGQAAQTLVALRLQAQLAHAAMHDGTTGLPNRRALEARREHETSRTAVVFLDLDGFKAVNDRLGHAVGDEVLREIAARLTGAVRADDLVARYGGDEFVVVCPTEDDATAMQLGERLLAVVREPLGLLPADVALGASVGVAIGTVAAELPIDRLIRAADQAMYAAKAAGGDRVIRRDV